MKSAGGDVRVVYSPLDALDHRPREPRQAGRVLRHRLRDHRAAQRDDGLPGQEARHRELQPAGQPRARAAGDRGDHDLAGLPGAGLPRGRARVHGDGDGRVPRRSPSGSTSRSWSPASSRSTSSRASGARCTSSRRAGTRSRTPTRARSPPRATRSAIAMLEDVFEVVDRAWRGIGMIPQSGWRLSEKYREYDAEHRFSVGDIHTQESSICRSRRGAAGADQAARVRGVRHGVHAAQPARRHDGVERGRVRGVLPLPAAVAPAAAAEQAREVTSVG